MNTGMSAALFGSIALILLGVSGVCGYEAFSLATGRDPLVSKIVAYTFGNNPHLYMIGVFVAGVILGALVTHFTNWVAA